MPKDITRCNGCPRTFDTPHGLAVHMKSCGKRKQKHAHHGIAHRRLRGPGRGTSPGSAAAAAASETHTGNSTEADSAMDDDAGTGDAGALSFSDSDGETLARAAEGESDEPAPLPAVVARLRRSLAARDATSPAGDGGLEWAGPSHVVHAAQPAAASEVNDDSISVDGVDNADDGDTDAEDQEGEHEEGPSESDQQWSCVSLAGFLASNSLSDRAGQRLLDLLLDPKFTVEGFMSTIGALKATAELIVGLRDGKDDSPPLLTKHVIDLNQLGLGDPKYGLQQPVHFYLRGIQQAVQDILQRCSLEDGFASHFEEQHDEDGNRYCSPPALCDCKCVPMVSSAAGADVLLPYNTLCLTEFMHCSSLTGCTGSLILVTNGVQLKTTFAV